VTKAWLALFSLNVWSESAIRNLVMPCFADAEHLRGQDGFTLQYGNPANPTNVTEQISKIRQHLFKMKGQTFDATGHAVDAMLPIAPCPGVEAEYTYM
jgi:hypothetical protein